MLRETDASDVRARGVVRDNSGLYKTGHWKPQQETSHRI